jgi:hypothetical protein
VSGGTIYLLGEAEPAETRSALFASEDDLQDIVARYPALLAGAQMTPDDPRGSSGFAAAAPSRTSSHASASSGVMR